MDIKALFNITYGLYVLSVKQGEKDNGCIVNSVMQVAEKPVRLAVSVSKQNLTCEMLKESGVFNLSCLTTEADFELFKRFGFQSGRDAEKFQGMSGLKRSENGLYYLSENTNAFLSGKVVEMSDLGTHMLFIAEVTDGEVLSDGWGCSYAYYQADIKPKPAPAKKKSWVCEVCGYVHEGEEVPDDFVCPICKHGKDAFRPA
ncbi:MAG: flavin reductase [Clostridia bacterium]|nr:flavin reductase [Clostridia bacterium]